MGAEEPYRIARACPDDREPLATLARSLYAARVPLLLDGPCVVHPVVRREMAAACVLEALGIGGQSLLLTANHLYAQHLDGYAPSSALV